MRTSLWWAVVAVALAGANGFAQEEGRRPSTSIENWLQKAPRDERSVAGGIMEKVQAFVVGAGRVLETMKADPDAEQLLRQAKGVLVLPSYARGGVVVGGEAGKGILLVRREDGWSGPAIYRLGAVNIGPQLGATTGSAALLLMTDRAVERFQRDHGIALNADAGLTVLDYSRRKHAIRGGDVVLWTDARGAYAGASLGVADLAFDAEDTAAIFGRRVNAREALSGEIRSAPATALLGMLPPG